MVTNASRMFLVKRSDKVKSVYGVSKLKTQVTVKSNIFISFIYIITSFIKSETTALLHLTEDASLSQI